MDVFDIEILADGTVKSSSGEVSPENHQGAEAFLKMLASLTGGTTSRRALGDPKRIAHGHHIHGDHIHEH